MNFDKVALAALIRYIQDHVVVDVGCGERAVPPSLLNSNFRFYYYLPSLI